jgi:hypothetical protein
MKKLVKLAAVREALDAYGREEVSYSRMVEMINEDANRELEKLESTQLADDSLSELGAKLSRLSKRGLLIPTTTSNSTTLK